MAPSMTPNYGEAPASVRVQDTEAKTIARLAQQAANAEEIYDGNIYLVANGEGGVKIIDTDDYAARPRRKAAISKVVSDQDSFEAYLNKHGIPEETEITASVSQSTFTAVINAGTAEEPGWGDHYVQLKLRASDEWTKWNNASGNLMRQDDFAEFIEDNAQNIVEPSSAEILEVAQSLQVKRGVEFESGTRLADGNVQFGYRETTNATAGAAGQLSIPSTLTLALRPFEGGEAYKVTAHFRYRLQGTALTLGFKLQEPTKIREDAFKEIAGGIRDLAELGHLLYLTNQ